MFSIANNARTFAVAAMLAAFAAAPTMAAEPVSLFDGKTLAGWEGDMEWWRVSNGEIHGGSLEKMVPLNYFLATEKFYHNFDLTLKIQLLGTEGFINSGVQIRSVRVPDSTEMSGYQVDYGPGWFGMLYDESRRNRVIAESTYLAKAAGAIKPDTWNVYRIRTEGSRIRSWINGVPALDFFEEAPKIAKDGKIALQIHGAGKALVRVKDIVIRELPATDGAVTWKSLGWTKD